jgi:hypothetical protein
VEILRQFGTALQNYFIQWNILLILRLIIYIIILLLKIEIFIIVLLEAIVLQNFLHIAFFEIGLIQFPIKQMIK